MVYTIYYKNIGISISNKNEKITKLLTNSIK